MSDYRPVPDRHDHALTPGDAVELVWGGEINRGRIVAVDTAHPETGQAHVYVDIVIKVPSRHCILLESAVSDQLSAVSSEPLTPEPSPEDVRASVEGEARGTGDGESGSEESHQRPQNGPKRGSGAAQPRSRTPRTSNSRKNLSES